MFLIKVILYPEEKKEKKNSKRKKQNGIGENAVSYCDLFIWNGTNYQAVSSSPAIWVKDKSLK